MCTTTNNVEYGLLHEEYSPRLSAAVKTELVNIARYIN